MLHGVREPRLGARYPRHDDPGSFWESAVEDARDDVPLDRRMEVERFALRAGVEVGVRTDR